jgi:AAA+ ATPase superfamily predicted ATPase
LTDKSEVEHIYSPIQNLIGRERDLITLVSKIASGQRLICLIGLPGIGKSSLVRNSIQFFVKRKVFLGGVVFIQAKGVDSIEIIIK